jgi:hypothetical protein
VPSRASQALPVHLRSRLKKRMSGITVSRLRHPNFREPPGREVRRITLPRTWVNKVLLGFFGRLCGHKGQAVERNSQLS